MNNSQSSDADSRDCVDVIVDLRNDDTPRALSPALWKFLEVERNKIARWSKKDGAETPPKEEPRSH